MDGLRAAFYASNATSAPEDGGACDGGCRARCSTLLADTWSARLSGRTCPARDVLLGCLKARPCVPYGRALPGAARRLAPGGRRALRTSVERVCLWSWSAPRAALAGPRPRPLRQAYGRLRRAVRRSCACLNSYHLLCAVCGGRDLVANGCRSMQTSRSCRSLQ